MKTNIIVGDSREVLKTLPDESVQCVITSPPYWGLRDYGTAKWVGGDAACDHKQKTARNDGGRSNVNGFNGSAAPDSDKGAMNYRSTCGKCGATRKDLQIGLEPSPQEFVAQMVEIFREVRRVLRSDGTCWLNLGDTYFGSGGAGGDYAEGGLKEGQPKWKAGRDSGGINLKPKDLIGVPWRVALALQDDGWWLRSDIIWAKPNPMPESVTDRPARSHEYIFLLTKSQRYYYDHEAVRTEAKDPTAVNKWPDGWATEGDHTSVAWQKNERRTDKQRGHGRRHAGFSDRWDAMSKEEQQNTGANLRDVWNIPTHGYSEAHFATFPPKLIEPCVKAGTKIGDTILDPFNGAGTTGLVSHRLERDYIGIELNPEYAEMARKRIYNDAPLLQIGQEP